MIKYDEWLSMMYVQICVQHQICGLGNIWSEAYARALPANWRPHLGQPRPCSYKESTLLDSSSKHVPRMLIESLTFTSGCWASFPNNQFASVLFHSSIFILANRDLLSGREKHGALISWLSVDPGRLDGLIHRMRNAASVFFFAFMHA